MNIKSLLIGSAAALATATVASAADAIVAAEPEPLEYVRICDAFGTGFFYIPGTETCLKIGGYARFQVDFGRDEKGTSDWDAGSRGHVNFDARSETELGALRGFIDLRFNADNAQAPAGGILQQGFIELGGFRAGKFDNWWDDGLSGETDSLSNATNFNSVRYNYDAGNWSFGVSLDELEGTGPFVRATDATLDFDDGPTVLRLFPDNNLGVSANLGFSIDAFSFQLTGGYDTDLSEGAIRAMLTATVGPGTFGLAGVYSSGANAYFAASEWAVAAEYAVAVSERLTITPAVQWNGNLSATKDLISLDFFGLPSLEEHTITNFWTDVDSWTAGLTVDYTITSGLTSKISLQYEDVDGGDDEFFGFVRLDRSF